MKVDDLCKVWVWWMYVVVVGMFGVLDVWCGVSFKGKCRMDWIGLVWCVVSLVLVLCWYV